MSNYKEQGGSLTVSGCNEARIILQGKPDKVEAHFKDHPKPSCNSSPNDELEYYTHIEGDKEDCDEEERHHHRTYFLILKWRVNNLREIVWKAFY